MNIYEIFKSISDQFLSGGAVGVEPSDQIDDAFNTNLRMISNSRHNLVVKKSDVIPGTYYFDLERVAE